MAPETDNLGRSGALLISIGGIFFNAIVIGFVVDSLVSAMEQLREGKSNVVEVGHHLILGWSDTVPPLVKELCTDAEGTGCVIVVLSEQETPWMEDILNQEDSLGSRIVCRTGDPALVSDLERCRAWVALDVIIASEPGDAQLADVTALRILLAQRGMQYQTNGRTLVEMQDKVSVVCGRVRISLTLSLPSPTKPSLRRSAATARSWY